jgi:hypothetical protein
MKKIILIFCILLFIGCNTSAQESWSKIEFYYSTGMVQPEYFYSYLITINSGMKADLRFDTPETFGKEPKYFFEFNLTPGQWGRLTSYIDENRILTREFFQNDILLMDGPKEYTTLYYFPNDDRAGLTPLQKRTPDNPQPQDESMLRNFYSMIKSFVPENIWKEINEKEGKDLVKVNGSTQTNWSSILYSYSNGTLPPPYHYEYTITLNPEGNGELMHTSGYEINPATTATYKFNIDNDQMNSLNNTFERMNVYQTINQNDPDRERHVGGPVEYLKVTVTNPDPNLDQPPVVIVITEFPSERRNEVQEMFNLIKSFVPENIWNDTRQKQEAYEKLNSN